MNGLSSIFTFTKRKLLKRRENVLFGAFTILTMFVGILNVRLLSNHYTVEQYGVYQLLMTWVGVFSVAALPGYDTYLKRHLLAGEYQYMFYVYKRVIPFVLVVCLSIAVCVSFTSIEHRMIIVAAICIVCVMIFDKLNVLLSAELQFKKLRYFNLAFRLTFLLLTTYAIVRKIEFESYISLVILIYVINHLTRVVFVFRFIRVSPAAISRESIRSFNHGAIRNTMVTGYAILASWIERLILGAMCPSQLALFSIGALIPRVVKDNAKSFLTPTFYKWSKAGFNDQYLQIEKHSRKLLLIGVCFFVLIVTGSPILIAVLFQKYYESTRVAQVLSFSIIPIFIVYAMAHAMQMSKHIEKNNRVELISNTLKIICAFVFVPTLEMWGAVISVIVPELVRLFLYYYSFRRIIRSCKEEMGETRITSVM